MITLLADLDSRQVFGSSIGVPIVRNHGMILTLLEGLCLFVLGGSLGALAIAMVAAGRNEE
jgi:hypothetical protein